MDPTRPYKDPPPTKGTVRDYWGSCVFHNPSPVTMRGAPSGAIYWGVPQGFWSVKYSIGQYEVSGRGYLKGRMGFRTGFVGA